MAKYNKPNSEEDVLNVMKSYCAKKGYKFSGATLNFFAEDCYLKHEALGWQGVKYWPAVAMRYILYKLDKQIRYSKPIKEKGESTREQIMRRYNEDA